MQNDFCKAVGLRALVFHETPQLTAMANDHGYPEVFCRPLELRADRGDLLIAVSSSGESANILKAAALAKDKGCHVVTFHQRLAERESADRTTTPALFALSPDLTLPRRSLVIRRLSRT